ncbi:Adaptor protein pacsin [Fasciola hepatica]|uniref:Adaptor protein pacsin n=1 Tax=Fasciola hepatica TaxID=6192 RepID=A0A4E0RQB9_FASHE|nr:Adaptor protein pacsin [Fasciola hepatica]
MAGDNENEQNGLSASSFWDFRGHQKTVKRAEVANKLCSELSLMIHERAELERVYAANLKRWTARWLSFLDSGFVYGTSISPWKGLCQEAEAISNAHQDIRNVLTDEIQPGLKHWQKEHFHKTSLPPQSLKESKQFEQDFDQAQKPWAKRMKKVNQCKKDYYQACKMERSLQVQVQNAKNDPNGTPEQMEVDPKLKKMQDKWKKSEKEVERTRAAYTNALSGLDADNPRYLEEMTAVFSRTQDFERDRLIFFKDLFANLHQALNVTTKADFNVIYRDLEESIAKMDIEADLNWWSVNHGVDMPAVLPQFEEYSPELTAISSKKRSTVSETNSGVTLTGITPVISSPEVIPNRPSQAQIETNHNMNGLNSDIHTPFDDGLTGPPTPTTPVGAQPEDGGQVSVPVGDMTGHDEISDADYYASATYDDGRPGIPVRALYDYTGQEDDEISFVAGDRFEKLEEADDQGWCKGRKDGRVGLYPANYAEEIDSPS